MLFMNYELERSGETRAALSATFGRVLLLSMEHNRGDPQPRKMESATLDAIV